MPLTKEQRGQLDREQRISDFLQDLLNRCLLLDIADEKYSGGGANENMLPIVVAQFVQDAKDIAAQAVKGAGGFIETVPARMPAAAVG